MKLDNYPYNGWDYSELGEALNICTDAWDDFKGEPYPHLDWDDSVWLKYYIQNLKWHGESRPSLKFCKELRAFLSELIKQDHTYWSPIWQGLLLCKSDYTLLQATRCLIGYMLD